MKRILVYLAYIFAAILCAAFVVKVTEAITGPFSPSSAAVFALAMLFLHELREHYSLFPDDIQDKAERGERR